MNYVLYNKLLLDLNNQIIDDNTLVNMKKFNLLIIESNLNEEFVKEFINNNYDNYFYSFLLINKDESLQYEIFNNFYFLIINTKNIELKNYLIRSNNFYNIWNFKFKFNDEFICLYINFIKSLSIKINEFPLELFYNYDLVSFPLITNTIKFINKKDNLINTSIFNSYCQILGHKDINKFPNFLLFPLNSYIPYICYDLYNNLKLLSKNHMNDRQLVNYINNNEFSLLLLNDIYKLNINLFNIVINNCLSIFFINNLIIELNNKYSELGWYIALIGILLVDIHYENLDIYEYFIFDNPFLYKSDKEQVFFIDSNNKINLNYFLKENFENIYSYEFYYALNDSNNIFDEFHNKIGIFYNIENKKFYSKSLYNVNSNYNPTLLYNLFNLWGTKDTQLLVIILTIIENILLKFNEKIKEKELDFWMEKIFKILFNKINFSFQLLYKLFNVISYNKNNYLPLLKNNLSKLILELIKLNNFENFEENFIKIMIEMKKNNYKQKANFLKLINRNYEVKNFELLDEIDILQKKIIFIYKILVKKNLLDFSENEFFKYINSIKIEKYKIFCKSFIICLNDNNKIILGFDKIYLAIYNKSNNILIYKEKYNKIKLQQINKTKVKINNITVILEDFDDAEFLKEKFTSKQEKLNKNENEIIKSTLKNILEKIN